MWTRRRSHCLITLSHEVQTFEQLTPFPTGQKHLLAADGVVDRLPRLLVLPLQHSLLLLNLFFLPLEILELFFDSFALEALFGIDSFFNRRLNFMAALHNPFKEGIDVVFESISDCSQ